MTHGNEKQPESTQTPVLPAARNLKLHRITSQQAA